MARASARKCSADTIESDIVPVGSIGGSKDPIFALGHGKYGWKTSEIIVKNTGVSHYREKHHPHNFQ